MELPESTVSSDEGLPHAARRAAVLRRGARNIKQAADRRDPVARAALLRRALYLDQVAADIDRQAMYSPT